MFSGIRYIFGYSDETATQAASEQSATSAAGQGTHVTVPKIIELSSANKLEQTLNAATTKFTEQLLPQQASIEELQTSSHQLLPSITEQHEEDELKKVTTTCDGADLVEVANEVDDDNDAFNEDSWELLDLVEKADDVPASVGLDSSVQVGDNATQQGLGKSTSGILKSQSSCGQNENGSNSQRRQKPKVSFGQSELVNLKREDETNNSNGAEGSGSGVIKAVKESDSVGNVDCQKVPTLNYAKALSKKLANEALLDVLLGDGLYSSTISSKANDTGAPCVLGPVKRVRSSRVSTSSWSSNEEEEEDSVEQVISTNWEISDEKVGESTASVEAKVVANVGDDESIASSDFSDCDYGFGGVNDYIMRPKKTSSKRGKTISMGSSSKAKAGRSEKKVAVAKAKLASAIEAKNELKSTENKDPKADSSRSTKPKKKRMIMTASRNSVSLTDFLKNKPGGSKEMPGQSAQKSASEVANQQAAQPQQQTINGGSNESSDIAEMDESWFVTPPPCFTKAVKVKDNSSLKVELPEAKEDDQENALIENPSVYIANAASKGLTKVKGGATARSKLDGQPNKQKCASVGSGSADVGSPMKLDGVSMNKSGQDKQSLKIAGQPVQHINEVVEFSDKDVASSGRDADVSGFDTSDQLGNLVACASSKSKVVNQKKSLKCGGKRQASIKSASVVLKRTDNKAWKNKFIVDAWDLDDDEDFDSDFDNMVFEPAKKRKSSKTKKGQQKQAKVKDDVDGSLSAGPSEVASLDSGPSSSVELLSVKSLAASEIDVCDDSQPEVDLDIENCQPSGELGQNLSSPKKDVEYRRPPTQVKPIEPERVPGWQLKRQRSKRRPLVGVTTVNKQQTAQRSNAGSPKTLNTKSESSSGVDSSSRSTPTLIDRIGCSIVANLTNLTSGFVSSGTMNYCNPSGQSNLMEGPEKRVVKRSNSNESGPHFARKQLSRGSMRRQNICAKQGNSLRRPDRRLKLFATPNGCSVNRKVHTNIH